MAKISEDTMSLSSSDTETETLCNSDSDHDPISDTKLSFSDVARMMTEMYTSVYKDFGTIPKKFGATFIRKYAKDDTVKNIDRLCMEMRTKCRDMFWESQSTSRRALVLLDDFTKVFLPFLMKPTSTVPVKDKLRHLEKYLKIIETDHEGAEKCRSGFTTLLEELREWIWSLEVGLQNNDELVGQEVKMLENDIEIGKQAIQE
ncbi:hypothetical protein DFH11DRAFT_1261239 [Phellopilus nigrolimitatus]|nr:hypothetical protein DFH11DRAFT_1261239 [Phellopilus nigrolimitatus]